MAAAAALVPTPTSSEASDREIQLPPFRTFIVRRWEGLVIREIPVEAHSVEITKSGALCFYEVTTSTYQGEVRFLQHLRRAFHEWIDVEEVLVTRLRAVN